MQQAIALIVGPGGREIVFRTDGEALKAWRRGREELMRDFGHGLWAWWFFEMAQFPARDESNLRALVRLGIPATLIDRHAAGARVKGSMLLGFEATARKAQSFVEKEI